jgi:hypothetical protein
MSKRLLTGALIALVFGLSGLYIGIDYERLEVAKFLCSMQGAQPEQMGECTQSFVEALEAYD